MTTFLFLHKHTFCFLIVSSFNCSSNINPTLNSYNQSDCPRDGWHTFTNHFVASRTGTQTLVFSFVYIFHATLYLTNVQVHDASNVQLLTNGNFSSSSGATLTGWHACSGLTPLFSGCTVNTYIVCYNDSSVGGTISQSFSVTSGTNYTLKFDMYHTSSDGNSGQITLNVTIVWRKSMQNLEKTFFINKSTILFSKDMRMGMDEGKRLRVTMMLRILLFLPITFTRIITLTFKFVPIPIKQCWGSRYQRNWDDSIVL